MNRTSGESTKVNPTDIAINNPSELMVVIPALAAGNYSIDGDAKWPGTVFTIQQ